MKWHLATRKQLLQIIWDEPCPVHLKLEAKQELERRKKVQHTRTNYRRKEMSR